MTNSWSRFVAPIIKILTTGEKMFPNEHIMVVAPNDDLEIY